jgi:predicted amidohydrolase YtcJ
VIPGLIDSHMHAVRAALSYSVEVSWIDARTIPGDGTAAQRRERSRPGAWLVVAGGWTEQRFEERRRPTPQEVLAAAHARVDQALLFGPAADAEGAEALGIPADVAAEDHRAARRLGQPTGWLQADRRALGAVRPPAEADARRQPRRHAAVLRRAQPPGHHRGVDPGGFSLAPPRTPRCCSSGASAP